MLCASRNHDFDSFYSVLAGLRLRDRTAKRAGVVTRCFSQCLIFRCFWIKPKAQEKSERRKTIGLIFREASRPFDSAFPANSSFPPLDAKRWHPKPARRHGHRNTSTGCKRFSRPQICTAAPQEKRLIPTLRCVPFDMAKSDFLTLNFSFLILNS